MDSSKYTSRLLEKAVNEFARLPGIGRKTALRLVLHLLRQEFSESEALAGSLLELRREIHHCRVCHNISDHDVCPVCSNPARERSLICVVETIRDVMAIESTQQYTGVYHVLGGILSPMEGIGPSNLSVGSLEERVAAGGVREIILALSATMEGDATNFYIYRKLAPYSLRITTLARGVAIGDELEYTDEITLGRSLINRTLFEDSMRKS
jgi:recombination protein RecR